MFSRRSLSPTLAAAQTAYAPESTVLDVAQDFETLPPAVAEDLGLFVDALEPASYPDEWLPDDAPTVLERYAGPTFTIGMPGDGTVVWTDQTEPPTVLLKKRAEGTPEAFLDFLVAEAFVQIDCGVPEHFLPFFGPQYTELAEVTGLGPADVYQIAAALFDGWVGLQTREVFRSWAGDPEFEPLYGTWADAGDRLDPRLEELSGSVAHGEMTFPEATEYACSAIKHDLDLPTPFSALDTDAFREYGADYAIRWAEKTVAALAE
ncbi:MAG: hypothetical protein R6V31_12640 [Halohasta sp.]